MMRQVHERDLSEKAVSTRVVAHRQETIQQITSEIPRLRRYARYLARDADHADDLVQDCIVRALEKIHTWQPGTNLRAWLLTILRNGFFNDCRKRKRQQTANDVLQLRQLDVIKLPAQQDAAFTLSEVEKAFMILSPSHREILLLIAIEGMSYEQAANVLGITVGTVKSRLFRARSAVCKLAFDGETAATALAGR